MTWEVEPAGEGTSKITVVTAGKAAGSRIEREFSGGIVFIVSGLKTYLETGEPMAVAAG
jgi:hypothetical protein